MNILGSNLSYSFLVIGAWIGVVCTLAIVGYRFYGDKSKRKCVFDLNYYSIFINSNSSSIYNISLF